MLNGKCALVTGSDAGLGYGMAKALAEAGVTVVLNGLSSETDGNELATRLARATGGKVLFCRADLADVGEIERMMAYIDATFGRLDILVNNAVVRHTDAIEHLTTANWNQSLAVNLSSAFHCIRLALPGMRANNWGRIINMSSIYGSRATANRIGYITTKTALLGMTRAVALEVASTGITCNAISPGTVPSQSIIERIADIAASSGVSEEEAKQDYIAKRHPSGRFVSIENVAKLLLFLCGPAGDDITGATLPIDGGWLAS